MEACPGFLHTIEKGDTLYRLSKRYRIPLWAILFANPYVNVYNLQVGDEICIPGIIQPRRQNWEDEM
jgi:LysM repeat protein